MPADGAAADVLRLLADCDSTGSLELTGPARGTFRLDEGVVTAVRTDAVPDLRTRLERGPDGRADPFAVARSVLLDGATVLLAEPLAAPPQFHRRPVGRGRPPGDDARDGEIPARVDVAELLVQASSGALRLARAGVAPDDVVALRPVPGGGRGVRLGPCGWLVLDGLGRPRSSRSLAWLLGLPLVDTVAAVGDLVRQQVCETRRPARRPRGAEWPAGSTEWPAGSTEWPAGPGSPASGLRMEPWTRPLPALGARPAPASPGGARPPAGEGRPPAGGQPALPRRRAAAGPVPPRRGPQVATPDRDVLLRVIEGLRRL